MAGRTDPQKDETGAAGAVGAATGPAARRAAETGRRMLERTRALAESVRRQLAARRGRLRRLDGG
jgi:hypothetical protein